MALKIVFAGDEHKFAAHEHMFADGEHKFAVHEYKADAFRNSRGEVSWVLRKGTLAPS